MESMMKLPDDMFKHQLLPYLTVHDIVKLDSACMNHKYRSLLLEKISGVISIGDNDESTKASLFKWLGMRRIYLIKMYFDFEDDNIFSSSIQNNYVDQFRYTHYLVMRGPIRDDIAIFIISHCPCLLSIDISTTNYEYIILYPQITDHTLQLIAENCTGLQTLSLSCCYCIKDAGVMTVSEYCPNLQSLKLYYSEKITDASIISISENCTALQFFSTFLCSGLSRDLRRSFKSVYELRAVLLSIYPSLSFTEYHT